MQVNFSGVGGDFAPIPVGTYEASLFSCKQKTASTGSPMLEWCFTIEGGDFEGRRIFSNTVLLPQSMWRLKQMLRGFDLNGQDLEGEVDFDPEDLIGQTVLVKVTQRSMPDGTMRNDIGSTLPYNPDADDIPF